MSEVISVRVSKAEQELLNHMSKFYGCGVSSLIKKLAFEKLEDEFDLEVIREYEKDKESEEFKLYAHEDVWKELNI